MNRILPHFVALLCVTAILCGPANVAQACAARPAGLTAWWTGDGTTSDITGGRNATLHNGAGYAAGEVAQAFAFDGVDDFVDVAATGLDVGAGDFSLMLWVNFDDTSGAQVLSEKYVASASPTGWSLLKTATNTLMLTSPGGQIETVPLQLTPGFWWLIAFGRVGGQMFIGGAGALNTTIGPISGNLSSTASFKLGHRGSPSDTAGSLDSSGMYLKGRIDEVLFDVGLAMTSNEIYAIVGAGSTGVCVPVRVCGNGRVEPTEVCDDGNPVSGDGCDSNCTPTGCGNGIVTAGEACDDGNRADWDGCQADCTTTLCGNAVVDAGEACDDGNHKSGDGCDANCTLTACGNGIVSAGETCDDGNLIDGDGCDSNCKPTGCGNGVVTAGEACDDGNRADWDGCQADCTTTLCGNGVVDAGEACDDGNYTSGDGCDANCTPTGCGNGIVTAGETCDDGNLTPGDGCDPNCTPTGCGNGYVWGEDCDDGNNADWDGCQADCTTTLCGNGVLDPGEACDDGNYTSGDGCDANCTLAGCGNGIVTAGEQCDDGNDVNGDGCDDNCTVTACGNGVVTSGERCDDGNAVNGDGCDNNCTPTSCGNGILTAGEVCDDNNGENGDGCDNNCTPTSCGNGVRSPGEECDDGNLVDGDGCQNNCRHSPGQLDPAFDGDGMVIGAATDEDGLRRCPVAVLNDGRIIAAYGGKQHGSFALAAYRTDGSVDMSFGTGGVSEIPINGSSRPVAMTVHDEKLIVVGSSNDGLPHSSGPRLTLARYDSTGALDPTFGQAGVFITAKGARANGVAVEQDGAIIVAGSAPDGSRLIARFLSNGTFDSTFDADGIAIDARAREATSMAVQPDGKIVTVGLDVERGGGSGNLVLARYNSNGSIDNSFGTAGLQTVATQAAWAAHLALQPDGRIVVAASVFGSTQFLDLGVYRFNADGSVDPSFSGDGVVLTRIADDDNVPGGIVIDADGRITVTGRAGFYYGNGGVFLARLTPSGVPDTAFATNGFLTTGIGFGDDRGSGIALQPDGKVVVAGDSDVDDLSELVVLRYLAGTCGDFRAQGAYGEQCDDGNATSGDGCEPDCTRTPVVEVVGIGGGIVSTDPLGEGATPAMPVQTSLTTPNAGTVSIAPPAVPAQPDGMEVVGLQLQIEAPPATADIPLSITLRVDASAIPPGVDPHRLDVTRDSVIVTDCTGPAGVASPDPCVQSRSVLADGDVSMTVLTSHASLWGMVVRGLFPGEQDCVNGVGKAAGGVTKAQAKADATCLKSAGSGKQPDVQACVLADVHGKIDSSMHGTTGVAAGQCVPAPPFGFTSANAVNRAAQDAALGLLADVLGPDLNAGVATDRSLATCQSSVLKSLQKLFDTESKSFLACAASGLAGTSALMVSAAELAGCYGVVTADLDGKIAKAAGKLSSTVNSKCPGGFATALLAGPCGSDADLPQCLDHRVSCRICSMFDAMDGLDGNCDLFDDQTLNGSCQ
ncbi:MAG TPA: DUF4215 domain-containing protein [Candidatus Binatia bacterium]|jgi:uncharacterized delta-60 repeat protein